MKSLILSATLLLSMCTYPVAASDYRDDDDIGPRTLKALGITELRLNNGPQNCIPEERRYKLTRDWKFDIIHIFNGGHGQVWQSQVSGNIMLTFEMDGISCVIGAGKSNL